MRTNPNSSPFNTRRPMMIALVVGIVAAVIAALSLFLGSPLLFFQAYLYAYLFVLGLSLGSLALLLLHFSVGSRWGLTIRRIAEAGAGSIWVLAILFIPILLGLPTLYSWARPDVVAGSEMLQAKAWYLNVPFFIIRAVIYFAVWIALAYFGNRMAARAASTSAMVDMRGRLQAFGSWGMVIYALTMTFAAVDWLMSLEPEWTSTAFGLIIIMAQVQTALAFAVLVLNLAPSLGLGREWTREETPVPFRDLGALTMTMVMGWAYVAFFQMLIQWAGNIPREVVWYVARVEGGWSIIAILIALLQFALPFILLLSNRVRHNMRVLAAVSLMLLVINVVTMFWHVKPAFSPGVFSISWVDLVAPIALGGIWLAVFFYHLARRPALQATDQEILDTAYAAEQAKLV